MLAIVYGFFSGGFTSLPPASVASTSSDMSRFGARFGMAVTMNGFGVLAGPPIAGAIIGDRSGYVRAGVFGGIITFVGGLGLVVTGTRSPGRSSGKGLLRSDRGH